MNGPQTAEPLRVELPPDLETFFNEYGYQACPEAEIRDDARLSVRGEVHFAFTKTPQKIESLVPAPSRLATGLIKDLSKSGIALLYHKQLFPNQELKIFFYGRAITMVVVRCHKLGPHCYEVGGKVLQTIRLSAPTQTNTSFE